MEIIQGVYEEKVFSILVNGLKEFFLTQKVVKFNGRKTIPLSIELRSFKRIPTIRGELYTENLEEAVFELLKKSKRNDFPHNEFPSIFVIDEAQFLIYDGKPNGSKKRWNFKDSKVKGTERLYVLSHRFPYIKTNVPYI